MVYNFIKNRGKEGELNIKYDELTMNDIQTMARDVNSSSLIKTLIIKKDTNINKGETAKRSLGSKTQLAQFFKYEIAFLRFYLSGA